MSMPRKFVYLSLGLGLSVIVAALSLARAPVQAAILTIACDSIGHNVKVDEEGRAWERKSGHLRLVQNAEHSRGRRQMWGYVWQGRPYEGLTCDALEWIVSQSCRAGRMVRPAPRWEAINSLTRHFRVIVHRQLT